MGLPQTANQPRSTLIEDTGRANDRLQEILGRVTRVGNMLHGPVPRDASQSGGGQAPRPEPTVRSNVDTTYRLIADIEAELARIESAV